jgi:hypothetical protein
VPTAPPSILPVHESESASASAVAAPCTFVI